MKTNYFILGIVVLALGSCKPDPVDPDNCNVLQLNEAEEVKLQERWCYSPLELEFQFEELWDSRCPYDVVCVWEGRVDVEVEILEGGQFFRLDTMHSRPLEGEEGDILLDGLRMSLLAVSPDSIQSTDPPAMGEYLLTVILQED